MADIDRVRRPEERVVQVAAPQTAVPAEATDGAKAGPSIAVLPFANMSGDAEQEYFADGMVEEIITGLSRIRWLTVIARNSSFAYKGTSPDVRKVGQELGARYVLEGSVRKGGNRVRVTGQLIDADTGHHVWAERDDRDLADVFELQDELTRRIVATLIPEVERAERERASTKPPENLDAWDCYLRGMAFYNDLSSDAMIRARALFDLDESHRIFETEGKEAFCRYQIEREDEPLAPGVAFNLVKKLLALNEALPSPLVEVILLSRNSADTLRTRRRCGSWTVKGSMS